ncbi:MAG TPA: sigma-70 family RNA polymerase sigma factor [Fimbriimonadaceae bacterium]|nr:sigma-70 family RNA polymerase sigma factor [Fimbriimonadaceae bacterium]
MTDKERARLIQNEDVETIRTFVEDHYSSVLRFMRHLTRSIEDAEDLTQQAFIQARENIASYRGGSSLRTWLFRVAYHEYTHWRRRRRRWLRLTGWEIAPEPGYRACVEGAALLEALHVLPAPMREAFLLFEVQEMSLEEVAEVMRVPVGTVKSRLHHARTRLRTYLQEQEEATYGEAVCERT